MKPGPKELTKFRASKSLRGAIRLRAAVEDVDMQDVIVTILTKALSREIEEVKRLGGGDEATPARRPRKAKEAAK